MENPSLESYATHLQRTRLMRILNEETDKKVDRAIIYLTVAEAEEMRDSLEMLIKDRSHHHSHTSDETFTKEITLCIYSDENMSTFDNRSKTLILNDE